MAPSTSKRSSKPAKLKPQTKKASSERQPGPRSIEARSAHPQSQTQNTPLISNYGVPMAPGSSVWPATMNMTKGQQGRAANRAHTPSAPKQVQKQKQKQKQDEVDAYQLLLNDKLRARQNKMLDEADRIQAAVNVGLVLQWTREEVVRTVKKAEAYARGVAKGEKATLTAKMMEVAGEEEVLGFERALAEDRLDGPAGSDGDGFARLKYLRSAFSGKAEAAVGDLGGQQYAAGAPPNPEDEHQLFAPLLLMKIQAALNIAFQSTCDAISSGTDDGFSRQTFEFATFRQKATHLLRVPNRKCGQEMLRLLEHSRLGRKRFGDTDYRGRSIAVLPGIERPLTAREKVKILERVKTELRDGRELIEVIVDVLGSSEGSGLGVSNRRLGSGGLSRRAMAQLGDDGFLLSNSAFRARSGSGMVVPDYVVDGEEEEEVESMDDGA